MAKLWRSPHDQEPQGYQVKQRALLSALALTLLAFLVQVWGSYVSSSLALLGDTLHLMTDTLSLALALFAVRATRQAPSNERSFGLYRLEVLAAFVNGLLLLAVSLSVAFEAWQRVWLPQAVATDTLLLSAIAGLFLNLFSAWILNRAGAGHVHHDHGHAHSSTFIFSQKNEDHQLHSGHSSHHKCSHGQNPLGKKFLKVAGVSNEDDFHVQAYAEAQDRNLNSAMMHVLSDAVGSCAVIFGAVLMKFYPYPVIDAVIGLGLALVVLYWSQRVIRDTVHVLLESTPKHIDITKLLQEVRAIDSRICALDDLHVWEITSRMYALSANVHVKEMSLREADLLRGKIHQMLENRFGIGHPTLSMQLFKED